MRNNYSGSSINKLKQVESWPAERAIKILKSLFCSKMSLVDKT